MHLNWSVGDYKYKGMPRNVKEFIIERLGKKEARELFDAIRLSKWIVITGPTTSGKTTIGDILKRLGYPYVIDADFLRTIHTSSPLTELREKNDIFESLGI